MEIGEGGGLVRWGGKGLKNGPLKALVLPSSFSLAPCLVPLFHFYFLYIYKKKSSASFAGQAKAKIL